MVYLIRADRIFSVVGELSAIVAEEVLELKSILIARLEPEVDRPRTLTSILYRWQLYSAIACLHSL